jgi:uncharacterized OsmC-like protein
MFPVDRAVAIRFRVEGNIEAERIKKIIDRNEKQITQTSHKDLPFNHA